MNANPSTTQQPTGDFKLPPQFSIDPVRNVSIPDSESLDITQRAGHIEAVWRSKVSFKTRLSKSVFLGMIEEAENDLQKFPDQPSRLANLALACLGAGDSARAKDLFERILSLDPNSYIALINLIKIHIDKGQTSRAIELSKAALDKFPEDPALSISLATVEANMGNSVKARDVLSRALAKHAKNPNLQFALGSLDIVEGNFRGALHLLRQASRSLDRTPQVHQALGVAYALSGQEKEAIRSFQHSLSLDKGASGAIRGLAQVMLARKKYDEVVKILSIYTQTHEDENANDMLATALIQLNRGAEARTILDEALARVRVVDPSNLWRISQLLNDLGCAEYMVGQKGLADKHFREAIAVCPNRGHLPYLNLAIQLHRNKNNVEAGSLLRQAIALFPEEPNLYLALAGIEEKERNHLEAVQLSRAALSLKNPAPSAAYAYVGWLLTDWFGDFNAALEVLRSGLACFPKDKLIANNLAYVLLLKDEIEEGAEILNRFGHESDDVFLTATNGLLALKRGNLQKAKLLYEMAAKAARSQNDPALAQAVMQKMHLEFAKYLIQAGDFGAAAAELDAGLKFKGGREAYERDLKQLQAMLTSISS